MVATNTKIIDSENPSSLTDTEGLVSISQAAKILGISIDTVRRWDKQGILKSTRPDGKNRYFSVKELEDVKFAQPLSISEVSEQLNVSPSTLRRLEAKGLIKPERNSADERVYDRKSLESFLQSQYFVRQKEFQEEVLEPLNSESKSESNSGKGKNTSHHDPATHALLGEHHVSIAQLKKFRQIFIKSVTIIAAIFVIIIVLLTLFFFLFPESASKNLGYYKKDPLGKHFVFQPQRSLFARQIKPFSQTSLRIVEAINPDLRKKVAPFGAIEDVNDVFQPDADGNVKSLYTFTVPDTSYLKIPDQGLVTNLNSQFVQGRIPGCEKGNIAIVGVCAGTSGTTTTVVQGSGSGGGTTIVNATTAGSGDGDITAVTAGVGLFGGGSEGSVNLRVEMHAGSGLEATTVGLSLARSCANNQLLKWNGFGWECANDTGGTPPDIFSTINASSGTSPVADNPNDQLSLLGSSGLVVLGEAINDTVTFSLDINVSGITSTTSSISGLETSTDGLRLLGGCSNNQILKWNGAVWICASDTGGIDVEENNSVILTSASVVNYGGNDFVVTNAGSGQVDVNIDYPNSKITRSNQNETIAGAWTLQQTLTFSGVTTDIDTASGDGLTLQGRASSSFVTTAGDISLNPSGSTSASVIIGGGPSNNVDLLILDRKNDDTLDPVGTTGAMYYNLASQKFRCYQGSAWTDCIGAGGGGGGSSVWSDLTGPVSALTLAHGEFPTTFNWSANNTLSANLDAFTLAYTNDGNSDPNTQRLLVLKNQNNGIVDPGTIKTEGLLRLEHNDDSILDKGIQIISSASGPINTAVDVSDGTIGTAINVGGNSIAGTTPNITFDNLLFVGSIGYLQLGSSGQIDGASVLRLTSGSSINLDATNNNVILADNDVLNIGGTNGRAYNSISGSGSANLATNDNDLYVEDILEVDGNTNLGGNLTVASSYAVGGVASGLYNAISNSGGTADGGDVADDNDLFVQGALEIDGNFNLGGTTLTAVNLTTLDCSDCIDWDDIKDALTLDAATTTTRTSTGNENSLVFNYINNGGTVGTDNYVSIVNAISSNTLGDLTTEALLLIDQADTVTTGTSAVENGLLITNSGGSTLTNAITVGAGSQAIATGINLASTGITTDLKLQNSETIDNDTDNQIRMVYGSTGGSLLLQNGSNLVTDQTTFNLLNTAATTINFGGTATTALNIGSTTTGVNNFAADTDWALIGTENITISNTSASTDQLSVSSTGVTTNNVDGLAVTLGTSTGAGSNNSAIHAIIGNAPVDTSDMMNGLEVTGFTQSVASTTQNLVRLTSGAGSNTNGILNALRIDNVVTAGGASTETAINIGTGWDRDINFESSNTILRLGATDNTASLSILDSSVIANSNLLQLRDLSTNFGAAVTSGAFISRNSYFGDEFNLFRASCTNASTATTQVRGDMGTAGLGVGCATAGSGEVTISSGVVGVGSTCTYSSNNAVNGFERISAVSGATASSARCLENMTTSTLVTNVNMFSASNLPLLTQKIRVNAASSTQRFYAGMGDLNLTATAAGPTNGIYFSNCSTSGVSPTCNGNLWAVSTTTSTATAIDCGVAITNTFMYLRIEVRSTTDVHYFYDLDVSNGITETECGSGISTTPTAGLTMMLEAGSEGDNLTTNLDIDYYRVWQDDNIQSETGLSGDNSTEVAIVSQQIASTNSPNRLTAYTLDDGSWVLVDSLGNQLAGVDVMGNATFKGEVTASGLNINGDDGSSIASIDKSGTATLSAVDTRQVRTDQVVAADIGQRYYTNEENLENGDVVMLDPSATAKVKKADIPNARGLIGVVTTGPSLLVDSQGTGKSVVVAAAGQVAVKVSTQNGAINAGDMLTSSSMPGVAMKSTGNGPVIGRATMSYSGEGVSSILVLVDNGVGIKDLTPDLNALSSRLDSLEQKFQASSTGTQSNGQDIDLSNLSVGALTVNLDMIVKGAMVVDGPATFKEAVRFEKDAIFDGNVAVNGTITVNNNSAGYAKIAAGEQRIRVIFSKPYANTPVITVSLGDGKFTTYSYRNVSSSGFEIMLKDIATEDLIFSWTATPVNSPQTFVNSANSP